MPSMMLRFGDRALEQALRRAIDDSQFFLVYQPFFDLRSGRMTGAEALLRWRHPVHGVVAPATFLPAAEASGLIVPIGEWVLRSACERAAAWRRGGRAMTIAVNVSPRQLRDPSIVPAMARALHDAGLVPAALTLDVPERVLCGGGAAVARLHELRAQGVRIAIDDFGSGLRTLASLRNLPVDALKVDRALVSGELPLPERVAVLRTIAALGRVLGLEVLAAGIETEAQLRALRELDLASGQGFLLGRPVTGAWLDELLDDACTPDVVPLRVRAA